MVQDVASWCSTTVGAIKANPGKGIIRPSNTKNTVSWSRPVRPAQIRKRRTAIPTLDLFGATDAQAVSELQWRLGSRPVDSRHCVARDTPRPGKPPAGAVYASGARNDSLLCLHRCPVRCEDCAGEGRHTPGGGPLVGSWAGPPSR